MSAAVATKPRAKAVAKPKAPEATPAMVVDQIYHLVHDIYLQLQRADEEGVVEGLECRLVQLAHEHVIPKFNDALKPDAFSEETVHVALNVLYNLQALLSGVMAMSLPHSTPAVLMGELLPVVDQVQRLMDRVDFWPAEPQISQGPRKQIPASEPDQESPAATVISPGDFEEDGMADVLSVMIQAATVAEQAEERKGKSLFRGILALVESATTAVRVAVSDPAEAPALQRYILAVSELEGTLAVLRAVNDSSVDDVLLYAVETLLIVVKRRLDVHLVLLQSDIAGGQTV